jgi:hypothetical protein
MRCFRRRCCCCCLHLFLLLLHFLTFNILQISFLILIY